MPSYYITKTKQQNTLMIETGKGDITIALGMNSITKRPEEILFIQESTPGIVGERNTKTDYKKTDDPHVNCIARITFTSTESLDVLNDQLNLLKSRMLTYAENENAQH